jgi:hypothetical protein
MIYYPVQTAWPRKDYIRARGLRRVRHPLMARVFNIMGLVDDLMIGRCGTKAEDETIEG